MDKRIMHVEIEFLESLLGSQPQRDVVTEFINPALPDDEADALPEKLEKATTAFHKVDGNPVLFNYQVKGFLKASASVNNGLKTFKEVKALKSKVENHIFVYPRIIPLEMPEGAELDYLERPLQAQTAQGPRVCLARSEQAPIGTKIHFTLEILDGTPLDDDIIRTLLEYGQYIGLGQWRNSGHGSFLFTVLKPEQIATAKLGEVKA